jgi:hypothetical protein
LRETKKHTLIDRVMKESLSFKQTIDVQMGAPQLVQFLVSNPFPEDEVFRVSVLGDEQNVFPELQIVHNEN